MNVRLLNFIYIWMIDILRQCMFRKTSRGLLESFNPANSNLDFLSQYNSSWFFSLERIMLFHNSEDAYWTSVVSWVLWNSFLPMALLTFWLDNSLSHWLSGAPPPRDVLGGILGLRPLDASNAHPSVVTKMSPDIARHPLRIESVPLGWEPLC